MRLFFVLFSLAAALFISGSIFIFVLCPEGKRVLSLYLSPYLSPYLSLYLSLYMSFYLSFYLILYLPLYLSI